MPAVEVDVEARLPPVPRLEDLLEQGVDSVTPVKVYASLGIAPSGTSHRPPMVPTDVAGKRSITACYRELAASPPSTDRLMPYHDAVSLMLLTLATLVVVEAFGPGG